MERITAARVRLAVAQAKVYLSAMDAAALETIARDYIARKERAEYAPSFNYCGEEAIGCPFDEACYNPESAGGTGEPFYNGKT